MNDDLVKRAAQWLFNKDYLSGPYDLYAPEHYEWREGYEEAAEDFLSAIGIEALTAERDRLKDRVARQAEQITGLEASRRKLKSLTAGAQRRVAQVEAECDRLREAHRFSHLHVEALSEIKAVLQGGSLRREETIESIVDGLLQEIAASTVLKGQKPANRIICDFGDGLTLDETAGDFFAALAMRIAVAMEAYAANGVSTKEIVEVIRALLLSTPHEEGQQS